MNSGSFRISRPPSGRTLVPNLVARKICNGVSSRATRRCQPTPVGWDQWYLVAFPSLLEPLPQQLFAVPVQRSRVPVHAPQFTGAVEELEAFLVRRGGSIKGWAGVSYDATARPECNSQLSPMRPSPRMGMVGPFCPSWRVGTVVDADMVPGVTRGIVR